MTGTRPAAEGPAAAAATAAWCSSSNVASPAGAPAAATPSIDRRARKRAVAEITSPGVSFSSTRYPPATSTLPGLSAVTDISRRQPPVGAKSRANTNRSEVTTTDDQTQTMQNPASSSGCFREGFWKREFGASHSQRQVRAAVQGGGWLSTHAVRAAADRSAGHSCGKLLQIPACIVAPLTCTDLVSDLPLTPACSSGPTTSFA